MTTQPSHHQQATAPSADHAETQAAAQAFLADIESILAQRPTSFRDESPIPTIGTTPPVTDQPGARRPPMSQRAVDLNTTILSTSVVIAVTGGSTAAVLAASSFANSTVIAWICGAVIAAPVVLAIPVIALKSLMKSAKEVVQAAPPEIHQHYSGPITQTNQTISADSHGLIAITRPQLPPAR